MGNGDITSDQSPNKLRETLNLRYGAIRRPDGLDQGFEGCVFTLQSKSYSAQHRRVVIIMIIRMRILIHATSFLLILRLLQSTYEETSLSEPALLRSYMDDGRSAREPRGTRSVVLHELLHCHPLMTHVHLHVVSVSFGCF